MNHRAYDPAPEMSGEQPIHSAPPVMMAKLGRYQVVASLGRGGMGTIHLAVAEGLGDFRKPLVLKELRTELTRDDKFVQMFFNEVRLASRLSHPNIVHTLEAAEDNGRYFLAMEFLDGQPLSEVLQAATFDGRLTLGLRLLILCEALAGLHYAHELRDYDGTALRIVHSDVSPQNILVTYDGQVKVVDFGIAKFSKADTVTTPGSFVGRFGYAAPEMVRGQPLDRRADIFAIGVMIWEAVTLRRFVRGTPTEAMVSARLQGTEPRLADVMPDAEPLLAAICDKAMHIDRNRRYSSAAELRRALQQYLSVSGLAADSQVLGRAMRDAFVVQHKAMHRLIATHIGDSSGRRESMTGESMTGSIAHQLPSTLPSGIFRGGVTFPPTGGAPTPSFAPSPSPSLAPAPTIEPSFDRHPSSSLSFPSGLLPHPGPEGAFDDATEIADLTDLAESSRGEPLPGLPSSALGLTTTHSTSPSSDVFPAPTWPAKKPLWPWLTAGGIALALGITLWQAGGDTPPLPDPRAPTPITRPEQPASPADSSRAASQQAVQVTKAVLDPAVPSTEGPGEKAQPPANPWGAEAEVIEVQPEKPAPTEKRSRAPKAAHRSRSTLSSAQKAAPRAQPRLPSPATEDAAPAAVGAAETGPATGSGVTVPELQPPPSAQPQLGDDLRGLRSKSRRRELDLEDPF